MFFVISLYQNNIHYLKKSRNLRAIHHWFRILKREAGVKVLDRDNPSTQGGFSCTLSADRHSRPRRVSYISSGFAAFDSWEKYTLGGLCSVVGSAERMVENWRNKDTLQSYQRCKKTKMKKRDNMISKRSPERKTEIKLNRSVKSYWIFEDGLRHYLSHATIR